MTWRAMILAHGGRLVERVQIKREPPSPIVSDEDLDDSHKYLERTEVWEAEAKELPHKFGGSSLAIPGFIYFLFLITEWFV